jgi:hypothetical protein
VIAGGEHDGLEREVAAVADLLVLASSHRNG